MPSMPPDYLRQDVGAAVAGLAPGQALVVSITGVCWGGGVGREVGRCVWGGGGACVWGAAVAGLAPGQALVVWVNPPP